MKGYRDFRLLTQARFLFTLSVQMQAVVMGWQVYELTRDPLYLGFIGLVEAVPALGLALFAGHLVDKANPLAVYKNVIRASLLSGLLLVLCSFEGVVPVDARLEWIYSAAFVTGMARGFSQPSLYSLIPQLVPREVLSVSSAWITSAFKVGAVTGPAIGGLLYAAGGPFVPYCAVALLLVLAQVSLTVMAIRPKASEPRQGESLWESVSSGVRFVFRHELLLAALALDMFAVLFGGATAVLPIFAKEILSEGPTGLGILRAAPSFGALIMSAALIRWPVRRNAGPILLWVVAGFGLATIGFGLSEVFWLSVFLLALSGALDSVSMVIRAAIVQLCSPDHMRGRIASVNSIFIGSSNELGAFESGVAAKLLGLVPSVVFGGTMTLLTVAATAWLAPRLRRMDIAELEAKPG